MLKHTLHHTLQVIDNHNQCYHNLFVGTLNKLHLTALVKGLRFFQSGYDCPNCDSVNEDRLAWTNQDCNLYYHDEEGSAWHYDNNGDGWILIERNTIEDITAYDQIV